MIIYISGAPVAAACNHKRLCCLCCHSIQGDGGLKKTILRVGQSWEKPDKGDECTGGRLGTLGALQSVSVEQLHASTQARQLKASPGPMPPANDEA